MLYPSDCVIFTLDRSLETTAEIPVNEVTLFIASFNGLRFLISLIVNWILEELELLPWSVNVYESVPVIFNLPLVIAEAVISVLSDRRSKEFATSFADAPVPT